MTEVLGGTDGFRGPVTYERTDGFVNPQTFARLTYAVADCESHQPDAFFHRTVVVGRDTRPSGGILSQAVMGGASRLDLTIVDLGVATTPMVQREAGRRDALTAQMVTASHNPPCDNGLKSMPRGRKPTSDAVERYSTAYWQSLKNGISIPETPLFGTKIERPTDAGQTYVADVVADIENTFGSRPLEQKLFVVDGARGAAKDVLPSVFRRLGANVVPFACDDKGPINENCGAAQLGGLKSFLEKHPNIVSEKQFVGAVAVDGDGDRMLGMGIAEIADNKQAVEITGNHIMWAMATAGPYRQLGIVGNSMTNRGLVERLQQEGIQFEYCAVGDTYVTQALKAKDWIRGGEPSGHFVDTEWLSSGDGVRMAGWLAAWAVRSGQNFGDVYKSLPLWAEASVQVAVADEATRRAIKGDAAVQQALSEVQAQYGDGFRPLLRPSGTEPVVRIWGEGRSKEDTETAVNHLAQVVRSRTGSM